MLQEPIENASMNLTYNQDTKSVGYFNQVDNCWIPWTYPTVIQPIYTSLPLDRTNTAFKIIERLIEKGAIKAITVKDFISLVNEISSLI